MSSKRIRPRILFLLDALDQDYQSEVTRGVVRAARRHNADLMILVGGPMVVTSLHLKQRGFVYEMATPRDFDGIIFLGTTLSSKRGRTALASLLMKYAALPTVSVGLDIGKGSAVLVDNAAGIAHLMEHLLDVHGYRRFAFISGPTTNGEAACRLNAFKGALAARGLTLSQDLLMMGEFTEVSGEAAMAQLIRERRAEVDALDAVVAANDSMAIGAMKTLKRFGFDVPNDVAVAGFDDVEAARYADTPLTTVQQPLAMQGEQAVQRLLGSMGGQPSSTVSVSPKLVIRRSCGCGRIGEAPSFEPNYVFDESSPMGERLRSNRAEIENDLVRVAERGGIVAGFEELLVNALIEEVAGNSDSSMTEIIETLVQKSVEAGERLHTWTAVIAALDRHLGRMALQGTDEIALVESVMHRARVAMSEAAERVHAGRNRRVSSQAEAFSEAAAALLTTMDAASFVEVAASRLPLLGIESCSISLFEPMKQISSNLKRLLITDKGRRLDAYGTYPASRLAAPELIDARPFALVIEPLCFFDDVFGVAALEYGPSEGTVYEQLGAFLSASIKGIVMAEENYLAKQRIEESMTTDPLTGLYNRRHLESRFKEETARAKKTRRPLSVIVMDLDDFRKLNEELGEKQGDAALAELAKILTEQTEPMDIVARLQEDEFAILLSDTLAEDALALVGRVKQRLKLAFQFQGLLAASFGVETVSGALETDGETLMKTAVKALLAAKKNGKNQAVHARDLK